MNCREICLMVLFELLLECSRTSAYYSKNYGEYNLTITDNAGYDWRLQSQAQQWCRENLNGGSSLASVTNADQQTNIERFANDAISANMLRTFDIHLNAQMQSTAWLWLNGQSLTNTDIQGQSSDASNYLLYAYLQPGSYSLVASRPTDMRSYLCQFSGETSNCGVNGFRLNGRCYRKYDDSTASWFDARNSCQREGGDLASFDYLTRETFSTLNSSGLYRAPSTNYWVGLKRLKLQWNDRGSEANFTNWVDGQPSDYSKKCICLASSYNWKWIQIECDAYLQFICLTVVSQTTTTLSSSSTSIPSLKPLSSSSSSLRPSTTNDSKSSLFESNGISTTLASPKEGNQQNKSDQAIPVGLGVGLGVGVPLIFLLIVGVALKMRTCNRTSKRDAALKKPEGDNAISGLGVDTVATDGDVANTYEGLKNDYYQDLNNYQTLQTIC